MTVSLLVSLAIAQPQFTVNNYPYDAALRPPANARLVWREEFNGPALDLSKWRFDTSRNKEGWWNNEKQYYGVRSQNVRLRQGRLILEAHRERVDPAKFPDWGGQDYTSGKIVSKGSGWTYGFFEIRARLPCGRGTWPAIWMLPVDMKEWPDDGEIDIMEHVGWNPREIVVSLHTGLFNHAIKTQRSAQKTLPTACTRFHRYQLDWRANMITVGFDGRAMFRVRNNQPGGKGAWPFSVPFEMILNLAIGGDWGGAKGIDDSALPQRMEVDYVRVWQVR